MPFELGLAVAHSKRTPLHTFYVFEEIKRRLSKSLSDLDGTDVYIHGATLSGLFAQILETAGADTVFRARPFSDLSTFASALADDVTLGTAH
jgi:hypothetical protein